MLNVTQALTVAVGNAGLSLSESEISALGEALVDIGFDTSVDQSH